VSLRHSRSTILTHEMTVAVLAFLDACKKLVTQLGRARVYPQPSAAFARRRGSA
jgi:hypothetical protein